MKIPIIPILLVVAGLLLPEAGRAQNSLVDRAARRYAAASWPEDSVFAGVVSNWIPVIPESLLENASVYTNREQTTSFTSTMLDWEMSPFVKKLDLRCFESPDFASSKRALLIELGGMQSTIPMSRGTNGLERLGEICYADLAQPSFVVFIRNNVFVSCFSSIDDNTLTNLLFSLDEQILASLETRGQRQAESTGGSSSVPESSQSIREFSFDSKETPSPASSPVVSKVLADLKMPLGCNDAITNEWSFPESVSQGGRTWVVNVNTNALELGLAPFTLADTNAIPTAGGKGIFFQRRNDCLLVEYIASRISSPEFFPTDYSALWNCQTNASGLTFLRSTTYSPNMPDYVLFKNVGVCISGITNSCELGVAFLRAGGVEIPDEPPLGHPEPE